MEDNEHVAYAAYFKEDTLNYIYPEDRFGALAGKNMADFAYSVTLAKFAKVPVVEGPSSLFGEEMDVFLFLQPIYLGADYIGEIVVAMDSGYVLSALGLKELEDGNYDYCLLYTSLCAAPHRRAAARCGCNTWACGSHWRAWAVSARLSAERGCGHHWPGNCRCV